MPTQEPGSKPAQAPAEGAPSALLEERLRQAARPRGQLSNTMAGSFVLRVALALSGVGLAVGFFMPWVQLGDMVAVSGFGLMVSEGQAVSMLAGPHRFLLFAVPMFGAVLIAGAIMGHRFALWAALATGIFVLGYGLFVLVSLFLRTTGLGMWLVVVAAFVALGVGLVGIGRPTTRRPAS